MEVKSYQTNFSTPSFGKVTRTGKAQRLMQQIYTSEQIQCIKDYEKELNNTKLFDMQIGVPFDAKELQVTCYQKHRDNCDVNFRGPLFATGVHGNHLHVRAKEYIGHDWNNYCLELPSHQKAIDAYEKLKNYEEECTESKLRGTTEYKNNNFKSMIWALESLKIMDKYSD